MQRVAKRVLTERQASCEQKRAGTLTLLRVVPGCDRIASRDVLQGSVATIFKHHRRVLQGKEALCGQGHDESMTQKRVLQVVFRFSLGHYH